MTWATKLDILGNIEKSSERSLEHWRGVYPNFRLKELWERKLPQLKEGHDEAMSLGKS